MANPWFRLYSEFDSDPKVQSMPEAMQRRLIMLFCETCRDVTVTVCDDDRAFHWRISLEELAATKAIFIRKGFCDEHWNVLNWEKRQMPADSSKERTKRWREKHARRHGDVTPSRCDGLDKKRIEEIRKEETKAQPVAAVDFPEWWPQEAWKDFQEFRRKAKDPLTVGAVKRLIAKLEKMRSEGQDPGAVLNQSVDRGWSGVFPVDEIRSAATARPLPASGGATLGQSPTTASFDAQTEYLEVCRRKKSGERITPAFLEFAQRYEREHKISPSLLQMPNPSQGVAHADAK